MSTYRIGSLVIGIVTFAVCAAGCAGNSARPGAADADSITIGSDRIIAAPTPEPASAEEIAAVDSLELVEQRLRRLAVTGLHIDVAQEFYGQQSSGSVVFSGDQPLQAIYAGVLQQQIYSVTRLCLGSKPNRVCRDQPVSRILPAINPDLLFKVRDQITYCGSQQCRVLELESLLTENVSASPPPQIVMTYPRKHARIVYRFELKADAQLPIVFGYTIFERGGVREKMTWRIP